MQSNKLSQDIAIALETGGDAEATPVFDNEQVQPNSLLSEEIAVRLDKEHGEKAANVGIQFRRKDGQSFGKEYYKKEIRRMARQGVRITHMAQELGVSRQRLYTIAMEANLLPTREESRQRRMVQVKLLHGHGLTIKQMVRFIGHVAFATIRDDHVRLGLEPHKVRTVNLREFMASQTGVAPSE